MRRALLFNYTADPTPDLYDRYQATRPSLEKDAR